MSLQAPLWRSIAVFRFASLAYAAILVLIRPAIFAHWGWAWAVIGGMGAWTVVSTVAYSVPARRTNLLLGADLPPHPHSSPHASMAVALTAGAITKKGREA